MSALCQSLSDALAPDGTFWPALRLQEGGHVGIERVRLCGRATQPYPNVIVCASCGADGELAYVVAPPVWRGPITNGGHQCWEMDYQFFAEQKKAQEARIKQEQRAGVIDQLLNDANKHSEKTNVEAIPATEVASAK